MRKRNSKKKGGHKNMTEENEVLEVENLEEEPVLGETIEETVEEPVETVEEVLETVEEPIETIEEPVETEEEVPEQEVKAIVTAARLNVRKEPNSDAEIIMIVNKNDVFTVLDEVNNYYFIKINDNISGYCVKDFMKTE